METLTEEYIKNLILETENIRKAKKELNVKARKMLTDILHKMPEEQLVSTSCLGFVTLCCDEGVWQEQGVHGVRLNRDDIDIAIDADTNGAGEPTVDWKDGMNIICESDPYVSFDWISFLDNIIGHFNHTKTSI